ncbi:MAG: Rieske (2Fe-2S) protein [Pseudomonadota bacterium]
MTQPLRSQPPQHYTDPAFFAQEQDAIFFKTWLFAAHESQVRDPGDYHCFEVAGQNLFLLRGRDGRVRCFYNVCQHRAHELLEGSGSRRVLVCPYHAWTYDLTGRLMKAPNDRKVEGFQRQEICLEEVRVESFHGFLFVNLDPDAAPMEAWYPGVHEALAAYVPSIDDLQPVQWMTLQEDCNWKI